MTKILLAEDEKELSRAIEAVLKHSGYEVDPVYDGEAAVELAKQNAYDVMVFDIMMPKLDGISAMKQIRAMGNVTPGLFLTAKSELDDKITGLDAGADDYLTKPFAMAELLARVRSMTRRATSYTPKQISLGSVVLDVEEQELKSENSIRLAKKEAKLMEFLMLNPNIAHDKESILNHVWKDEDENADIVNIYIAYLRTKLQSIDANLKIEGDANGPFTLVS